MTAYLYGLGFKHAVIAGAQRVVQMRSHLDDINVFPVPDADTGTNVAFMMRSVAEALAQCNESSLANMSEAVAHFAFMNARGSSGAILAQYFQGLAEGFRDLDNADPLAVAKAAVLAAELARQATAVPQEGTILTVTRDWAARLRAHSAAPSNNPHALMESSLEAARASLRSTTVKLEALRKAGVVDAGGQAFVYMLEGAASYMRSGTVEDILLDVLPSERAPIRHEVPTEITFQFCTQATVVGTGIDRNALLAELRGLGDSVIVAGSSRSIHLHIHSNDPDAVFARAGTYGVIVKSRREDMRKQHTVARERGERRSIAIITDSSCDLPEEDLNRYRIHVIPHTVTLGLDSYVESTALTSRMFYSLLETSPHFPRTAHAGPADFHRVFLDAAASHSRAFAIMLSGAISGALASARNTAGAVKDRIDVQTIDSKSTSVGLGLIVLEAARAVAAGMNEEEIRSRIAWAIRNVRIFVSVETVEYLMRGGRVGKLQGLVARALGVKPILTMSSQGEGEVAAKALGGLGARSKLLRLLGSAAFGKRNVRFLIGHANAPETATFYAQRISEMFHTAEPPPIVTMSMAFGAHLGCGAAAVAFLEQFPEANAFGEPFSSAERGPSEA